MRWPGGAGCTTPAARRLCAWRQLSARIEELVSGRSTTKPRELRDSDEYRKTYEAVLQFAERNDPHDVAGFCQRDGTVEH